MTEQEIQAIKMRVYGFTSGLHSEVTIAYDLHGASHLTKSKYIEFQWKQKFLKRSSKSKRPTKSTTVTVKNKLSISLEQPVSLISLLSTILSFIRLYFFMLHTSVFCTNKTVYILSYLFCYLINKIPYTNKIAHFFRKHKMRLTDCSLG